METWALAIGLVLYSTVANRWPPFNKGWFVPANLLTCALVLAYGYSILDLESSVIWGPDSPLGPGLLVLLGGALLVSPLFALARSNRWAARIADKRVAHLTSGGLLYQALIRVPFGTALLEEVAFRGVLFGAWAPEGNVRAAILSSVAFGLWHISPTINMVKENQPDAPTSAYVKSILGAIVFTGAAGLGFVWLREVTDSLAAPLLLHATVNSLATVAAVVAHRRI